MIKPWLYPKDYVLCILSYQCSYRQCFANAVYKNLFIFVECSITIVILCRHLMSFIKTLYILRIHLYSISTLTFLTGCMHYKTLNVYKYANLTFIVYYIIVSKLAYQYVLYPLYSDPVTIFAAV